MSAVTSAEEACFFTQSLRFFYTTLRVCFFTEVYNVLVNRAGGNLRKQCRSAVAEVLCDGVVGLQFATCGAECSWLRTKIFDKLHAAWRRTIVYNSI